MGKLLPVILTLLGLAAGGGAGFVLQPAAPDDGHGAPADGADHAAPAADAHADAGHAAAPDDGAVEVVERGGDGHDIAAEGTATHDYVKLSNQFVVPIVDDGQVASMIVLSLSLEVTPGGGDSVYAREPKLRDALLQVLFDHAGADGFRGRFTDAEAMLPLRRALREAAVKVLPGTVQDVLISDILRHDS